MPLRVTARQRAEVTERARNRCEYCQSPARFATEPFSVEHIHPRHKGGENNSDNLALSCQGCNGHKHIKTTGYDYFTKKTVPLFHPRRQHWSEHFAWNDDCTRILGLTPTGRATVQVLHLNREPLMSLRTALIAINQHPPEEPAPSE